MGVAIPAQVVLGSIRKAEQLIRSKAAGSPESRSLLSSRLKIPALTSLRDELISYNVK